MTLALTFQGNLWGPRTVVGLERPLMLFGKTFKVHCSTGLTLSPDTLMRAALGVSLQQLLRESPNSPDLVLKGFWRAFTGTSRPRMEMRNSISQLLGSYFPVDVLQAALDGVDLTSGLAWQSEWESFQQGMGEPRDDWGYQLVAVLARLDRMAWSARQMHEQKQVAQAENLIGSLLGESLVRWKILNPRLLLPVMMLVDIGLQILVWLERRQPPEKFEAKRNSPVSELLPLLSSDKKPLGHWLVRVQRAGGLENLEELSSLLFRKKIKWHHQDVSHDLLKKWSSCGQLMPRRAAEKILTAVAGHVNLDQENAHFATARFLSFLCDLVIAGTRSEPPPWHVAQAQIRMRYEELFNQETFAIM
jgi:hypothetical protein